MAASAPGQQEGGNAKQRRDAKRKTARRECEAEAPTTPPRTRGLCPPSKAMRRVRTPLCSASPEGQLPPDSDAEEAEVEEERSPMVEVAPATAQEVGAPEEIAPEAAGELGAGAHAPLAASPAFPSCSRLVKTAMPETKEAAVPTTPPRAFLATACPPSSGKRGPSRSCSLASPGSSGGRLSPPTDADGFQLVISESSWAGWGRGGAGRRSPRRRGRGRGVGVCDFCDDYDYGIKQVAGNDDYDYGIKQAGNDDYDYDEGRFFFF